VLGTFPESVIAFRIRRNSLVAVHHLICFLLCLVITVTYDYFPRITMLYSLGLSQDTTLINGIVEHKTPVVREV